MKLNAVVVEDQTLARRHLVPQLAPRQEEHAVAGATLHGAAAAEVIRQLHALAERTHLTEQKVEQLLGRLELAYQSRHQLLIAVRDALRPVRLDQIVYVEVLETHTVVHTVETAYETDASLAELKARLPASDFLRIRRGHLVNRAYIAALHKWGRQLKVELTVSIPAELYVSRRCVDAVLQRLGSAG